jgi:peptide deformylase
MALLEILTYPDPFLRKSAKPVTTFDDTIEKIIQDMSETMYDAPGVGLAATQAGIDKRIIVFDPEADPNKRDFQVIINPEIIDSRGEMVSEDEGCLSVPDFRANVKRSEFVVIEALDRLGNPVTIDADGLLSVILQHEIDHINGILFIDRISALKRHLYIKKIKKALKNARAN